MALRGVRQAGTGPTLRSALLLPGVAQWRCGRRFPAVVIALLLTLVVAATVVAVAATGIRGWKQVLWLPQATAAVLAASASLAAALVVSTLTSTAGRLRRASGVLAASLPLLLTAWVALPALELQRRTFVEAPVAVPSPPVATSTGRADPDASFPGSDDTTPSVSPSLGSVLPPGTAPATDASRLNVLLIGGDAGPGRWGLRADSLNVVSVDLTGGPTVVVGVPRNLYGAPLPPGPLRERFPDGFPGLVNALYTWGSGNAREVAAALGPTGDPGASLTAAAVAEVTGLRIDGWVLVDMAGFVDVIDALGGVDVHVPRAVPAPGNIPGVEQELPEVFEVGWHRMDGTLALAYVRSRSADSDYARMSRQRCVLASLAAQHAGPDLALRWPALASVVADTVRTNLAPGDLLGLVELSGAGADEVRTVALVPPAVPSRGWDLLTVRSLVAQAFVRSVDSAVGGGPDEPASGGPPAALEPGCLTRP